MADGISLGVPAIGLEAATMPASDLWGKKEIEIVLDLLKDGSTAYFEDCFDDLQGEKTTVVALL